MTLHVLSYNILSGGQDRLPLIANIIHKQQPDVVSILEANSYANVEALAHQLNMHLTFGEANERSQTHIAWLSRFPVLQSENYRLPIFAKTLLRIEILWEGTPLVLFATHLKAGQSQENDQRRAEEIRAILDILRPLGEKQHLLVGDLNTIHPTDQPDVSRFIASRGKKGEHAPDPQFPGLAIPLLLEAGYIDCYRTLHTTTPGYTYKLPTPGLRIDYIFASPSLAQHLQACDIVTGEEAERASDHLPIWAKFRH
jgi:exodeoxyribonuclease III